MGFSSVGPILEESVSAVTATNSVELGTRRIIDGDEYVYCYNNTGSLATAGALMIQSAVSGYSLTRSTTIVTDYPMVAVKNVEVPAGSYFWGLVRGSVNLMSIAMSAGEALTTGADGNAKTMVTGYTGPLIGRCITVSTASARPLCFVRLWG